MNQSTDSLEARLWALVVAIILIGGGFLLGTYASDEVTYYQCLDQGTATLAGMGTIECKVQP